MADTALQTWITAARYLTDEEHREVRHEFIDGAIHAVIGGSLRHSLITQNLSSFLIQKLPERCAPFSSDVKLHVRSEEMERFYYPDVFVVCGAVDVQSVTCDDAVIVAEVLSPSTERIDEGEKFAAYKLLPYFEEYLLIAQSAPQVALFRRRNNWAQEIYGTGEQFTLESVDLSIPVDELYRRVSFSS